VTEHQLPSTQDSLRTRSNQRHRNNGARTTGNSGSRRPASPPVADYPAEVDVADDRLTSFAELGLAEAIVEMLQGRGITTPTPIQARTIPDALAGRDLLGRAQTGSGKTLAFGLPMLTRINRSSAPTRLQHPRGLVLVPTRELARQVADELAPVANVLGLTVGAVFGGASMGPQVAQLRGGVDVVIATPGRLLDHMARKTVFLDAVEIAVLDEADHMADLGFLPSVSQILDATPAKRQSLLFSATLDRGVDRVVARYLTNPAVHAIAAKSVSIELMQHHVFSLRAEDKPAIAAEIAARPARTLFFVRTKHGADRLAKQLVKYGINAGAIHGNLNQNQRLRALDAFTSGRARVLVATDVAARGLHVDDLDLVVHYDPPNDHKDYVHRSGRTARAGASGTVVSLVEASQGRDLARMHAAISVRPQIVNVAPGHQAVRAIAESGEVIDVVADTAPARPANERSPRTGRPARSPHSSRPSRPARTGSGSGGNSAGNRHRPAARTGRRNSA
jgi:superfamily II DNA/RNA helicase